MRRGLNQCRDRITFAHRILVRWSLPALWFVAAAGCGTGASPPVDRHRAATTQPPIPTHVHSGLPTIDTFHHDLRFSRVDPANDGWSSEVLAEEALQKLRALGHAACSGNISPELVDDLLASDFVCTPLRPGRLHEIRAAGPFTVRRPARESAPPRTLHGGDGLREALREWLAGYDPRPQCIDWQIVSVAEGSPEPVRIEVAVLVMGHTAEGRRQQSSTWRCDWRQGEAGDLRLARVEVAQYEETAGLGREPLFADATLRVLGHLEAYQRQLQYGIDHWQQRLDSELHLHWNGYHGLAIGDANGDGLDDVYLCQPGGLPNRLLVQAPDGTVRDVSASSGTDWMDSTHAALFVDLDNNGSQDLVVAFAHSVVVLANDGQGNFSHAATILTRGEPMSLSAADYDGDGDLDLYVCHFMPHWPSDPTRPGGAPRPLFDPANGGGNQLLRNDESWRFVDVTAEVGLDVGNRRFSASAAWEDYDNDGDQDLYVSSAYGRGTLYRNQAGHFVMVENAGASEASASYSAAWSDLDGDGWMDLLSGGAWSAAARRIVPRPMFRADGAGHAPDILNVYSRGPIPVRNDQGRFTPWPSDFNAAHCGWVYGSLLADVNNDGHDDLVAANGHVTQDARLDLESYYWRTVMRFAPDTLDDAQRLAAYDAAFVRLGELVLLGASWSGRQRNRLYVNLAGAGFADVSTPGGLDHLDDGRAVAVADWDDDGCLDLWLTARTGPQVRFLHNRLRSDARWLQLRLVGTRCNRDAIGARAVVELADGRRMMRTLRAGGGFLSGSSKGLHFAWNDGQELARVVIAWPDGLVETFADLVPDTRYRLVQHRGAERLPPRSASTGTVADVQEAVPESTDQPPRRIVALSRPSLPEIGYFAWDGQSTPLEPPGRAGMIVHLWSVRHESSCRPLANWAAEAPALEHAGLSVVAISVDALEEDVDAAGRAEQFAAPFAAAFRTGIASVEFTEMLDLLHRVVLGKCDSLPLPTTFLLDAQRRVTVIYKGPVEAAEIIADARLLNSSPDDLRAAATPFSGRWGAAPLAADPLVVSHEMLRLGRLDPALRYLRQFLPKEDQPEPPDTRLAGLYDGVARLLRERGQYHEAVAMFRKAVAIDPNFREAYQGLAQMLMRREHYDQAAAALREVLRIQRDADTLTELGLAEYRQGRVQEAARLWREALQLQPGWIAAANNLAWILATTADQELRAPQQAVELARQVCAQSAAHPSYLDTLAVAYAAAGQFAEAVNTAQAAVAAARKAGEQALADRIEARIVRYQSGQPYIEPAAGNAPNQ